MRMNIWKTAVAFVALVFAACSTTPKTEGERLDLANDVKRALAKAKSADPTLESFLNKATAYAVFPSIGKGGLIVGGAYGRGEVYANGTMAGYCDVSSVTLGAQIGGQSFTEIVVFEGETDYRSFKNGHLKFTAQVSAVALKEGSAAATNYRDGVAVFVMNPAGLMLEASIGGQQFSYQSK